MVQTHKPLNDAVVFGESLIDDIQGGVIICQLEPASQLSKTIYVSEGWTQLTGYTIEQLEECFDGDPTALILPEDRRQSLLDYENCLSQGRSYQSQYRIRHRDGRILWCIDRGVATSLGNGVFQNQSILTDITLLKENEERLRHEARSDALTRVRTVSIRRSRLTRFRLGLLSAVSPMACTSFRIRYAMTRPTISATVMHTIKVAMAWKLK